MLYARNDWEYVLVAKIDEVIVLKDFAAGAEPFVSRLENTPIIRIQTA